MRRDDLVCAQCNGPVSEGRCAVCRAARKQFGRGMQRISVPFWLVLAVAAALIGSIALQLRYA